MASRLWTSCIPLYFIGRTALRSLLAVFLAYYLTTSQSVAADITRDGNTIKLSGEIKSGDFTKFLRIVKSGPYSKTLTVHLESEGGLVAEAIGIGDYIHKNKYDTYVAESHCASACALIWLAGRNKYRHPDSRIGFHNAYNRDTRKAQSNGIVGHYLSQLGYSYKTVLFATEAAAENLKYLTRRNKQQADIEYIVKYFE